MTKRTNHYHAQQLVDALNGTLNASFETVRTTMGYQLFDPAEGRMFGEPTGLGEHCRRLEFTIDLLERTVTT